MDTRHQALDGTAVAALLLCCALWGLGQVASKVALTEIPPLMQAAARSLGAALLVAAWARWRGIALWRADGTLRGGLAAGVLFGAEFGMIFVGLQYTGAARMTVFLYLSPFVVALGMPFIARGERLGAWQIAGLLAAFAGVAWAFAEGFVRPSVGAQQWHGDALAIGAALLWGSTTLVIRATALAQAPAEKTLLYQLVVSGIGLAAASAFSGEAWPQSLSLRSLGPLAYQVFVVSSASYVLWFWLMRHYPATLISAFVLLTPVFGLLAGVLLLHEPLTARLLVALLAVAGGIAVVNLVRPRRGAAPVSQSDTALRRT